MPCSVEFSIGMGIGQRDSQKPPEEELVLWREPKRSKDSCVAGSSTSVLIGISKCRLVHLIR